MTVRIEDPADPGPSPDDQPAGERLDAALARRGLARSRTHAARLLADGLVTVNGSGVVKASSRVGESDVVTVAGLDHYVSRAAHKLVGALDAFGVDPRGRTALDVGASTGGFTQVLLERGAEHVVALDVGHGQLSPSVRSDARVTVVEGVNARYLDRDQLRGLSPRADAVDLVVADLSFISLTMVLPALVGSVPVESDFVLLVKPQFEVGRQGIREGIVHDAALRNEAVTGVLWAAHDLGLGTAGLIPSPIVGTAGNKEYVVRLSALHGSNPTEWLSRSESTTGA
ncbi:TlyA family RNA methyltransferase [Frigoribacterium faeni]|uniref:TlyA family RNA methyltransferase n=1 Tax=Frigoribacterium faeni TaxID=145483 RepID=UPI00141AB979|nr:TlyA family RNA methyltransferase [Frigoribacterium faeni]NIJ04776.1 23S rRNA (cytidine1920-2'-O)/16S rRNA (cytidine1409-2'-O)-methyltransferase [Frigoribacterium faeni]